MESIIKSISNPKAFSLLATVCVCSLLAGIKLVTEYKRQNTIERFKNRRKFKKRHNFFLDFSKIESIPEENSESEESLSQIDRFTNVFEGLSRKQKVEIALKIVSDLETMKDKMMHHLMPNHKTQFLQAFKDMSAYKALSLNYISCLDQAVYQSNQIVRQKYNFEFEQIGNILFEIDVYRETFKYQREDLQARAGTFNEPAVREAFKFYYKNVLRLEQIYAKMSKNGEATFDKVSKFISRRRIADEMTLLTGVDETSLKFYTFEFNLLSDPELSRLYKTLHCLN